MMKWLGWLSLRNEDHAPAAWALITATGLGMSLTVLMTATGRMSPLRGAVTFLVVLLGGSFLAAWMDGRDDDDH